MGPVKMLALLGATALLTTAAMPPIFRLAATDAAVSCRAPVVRRRLVPARRRRRRCAKLQDFRTTRPTPRSLAGKLADRPEGHEERAFIGFGVGYAWNNWLRFDATGEYRSKVKFKVLGSYTDSARTAAASISTTAITRLVGHQRLFRSRHLVVPDAVHRCRRRRCPPHGSGLTDIGFITDGTTGFGYADQNEFRSGTSPGLCTPASATTSPRNSRSNSPIAT